MKTIARTLAILCVALLVCGATFALAGSSYAPTLFSSAPARGAGVEGRRAPELARGAANSEGSAVPRAGARLGGFGALELLKNLAIVAVIVAVAAPLRGLARRRPRSAARLL
jgi:hypothetical protein